jgi:hypothetical protein
MICPKCHSGGPDGKAYCADCGSPLDPVDEKIRAYVQAALRDSLKDQKSLPIEIADKAVERFWFYAKLIAVPSGLVLLALAVWGISSYKDAVGKIQTAGQQAVGNIQATGQQAVGNIQTVGQQAVAKLQDQASKGAEQIDQTTTAVVARLTKVENKNLPAEVSRVWEVLRSTSKQLETAQAEARSYQEEYSRLRSTVAGNPPLSASFVYANPTAQSFGLNSGLQISTPVVPAVHDATYVFSGPALGMPTSTTPGLVFDRPSGTVTIGQESDYVKRIQSKLIELGCYGGTANGKFGPETSGAVIRFKKAKPQPYASIFVSSTMTANSSLDANGNIRIEPNGDVDFLTWFDLMESSIPRLCN